MKALFVDLYKVLKEIIITVGGEMCAFMKQLFSKN